MGGTITWQQGHDYQPTGDKLVCVNCGHATEAPAQDEAKSETGMSWLWWVLGAVAIAMGALVVLKSKKKEK